MVFGKWSTKKGALAETHAWRASTSPAKPARRRSSRKAAGSAPLACRSCNAITRGSCRTPKKKIRRWWSRYSSNMRASTAARTRPRSPSCSTNRDSKDRSKTRPSISTIPTRSKRSAKESSPFPVRRRRLLPLRRTPTSATDASRACAVRPRYQFHRDRHRDHGDRLHADLQRDVLHGSEPEPSAQTSSVDRHRHRADASVHAGRLPRLLRNCADAVRHRQRASRVPPHLGKSDGAREVVDPHRQLSISAVGVHEDLHGLDARPLL